MATYPTVDEITEAIENAQAALLPDQKSMDKLTLHYIANRIWAAEIRKCYNEIDLGLMNIDPLRATGDNLTSILSHILTGGRILGNYATGAITFKTAYPATSQIVIPAGTKCYAVMETRDKVMFETTVAGAVLMNESAATIAARAVERGTDGNVGAYTIMQMDTYIPGISSCENSLDFSGGTPDEDDVEFRERYFDAVYAPGKATPVMLERALDDISTVSEVRIITYGQGDVGIIVDHSGGIAETSQEIVMALWRNLGGGIHARGCLAATIDGSNAVVLPDDVYGGKIWVRPRNHISAEDTFGLTYSDMDQNAQSVSPVIPAGTHRGDMVEVDISTSRAKKILTVTPSGAGNNYDILLGMGEPGLLYNLPEQIEVSITANYYQTATPETGLKDNIEASLADFIRSLKIGERIEYSDAERFFNNQFDASELENIGRPFMGIGEIRDLAISGGGETISAVGQRLLIEEDGRFVPGNIVINIVTE